MVLNTIIKGRSKQENIASPGNIFDELIGLVLSVLKTKNGLITTSD